MPITLIEPYDPQQFRQDIIEFYKNLKVSQESFNFHKRLEYFSQIFLDKPYLRGALGEGPNALIDQNPLYRTDKFDCLTYVNTVLALALAKNINEFEHYILRLNYYEANANFQNRYHFQCVDWNIQNQNLGIIADITNSIVNSKKKSITKMAVTLVDRSQWFLRLQLEAIKQLKPIAEIKALELLQKIQSDGTLKSASESRIAYLPKQLFYDGSQSSLILAQIPHGCIIEIVRANWDLRALIGTALNISHLGFGFWIKDVLQFRHASLIGKVMQEPLSEYLLRFKDNETVSGIHVLQARPI